MPGAQPFRSPVARAASTARRGSNVPAGVPGVYRVPRRRVVTVQAAADTGSAGVADGWIQPPAQTVEPTLAYVLASVEGDEVETADFPAEAVATMNLLRTDGGASLTATIGSRYDKETVTLDRPVAYLSHLVLAPGFNMPATVPDLPPGAVDVEYEAAQGTFISATLNAVVARVVSETSTLRRVGATDYDPDLSEYGIGYYTPAELAGMGGLAVIAVDADPFTFTTGFDLDAHGGAAFVLVHNKQLVAAGWAPTDGGILLWDDESTTVEITYLPPRYRFVYVGGGDWTASVLRTGFVWDAGLYLPSDFDSLTGYPASLPSGCAQLTFWAVPSIGYDFLTDIGDDQPSARALVNSGGNGGPFRNPGGANTPDPDTHLWVVWEGPAFDPATDPTPGVSPASLVPAVLAENGTA